VPVLNLLARRSRKGTDLFGNCSDDDLMSWGRDLADHDEPIFADRPERSTERTAAPGPRLALPLPAA